MKILVTGGCGFIGSNLAERLTLENHSVTILDNLETGSLKNIEGMNVEFRNIPYSNLQEAVPNVEVIFHLGLPSSSPMYKMNPRLVGNTMNDAVEVFQYAKENNCKVIYASSSNLYNGNKTPYRESMKIYVKDYYAECRYFIERLAKLYNELFNVRSVGLRFFSVYGLKEAFKGTYANIVTQFLWAIQKNKAPVIYGDGSQTRDFINVEDVVESLMLSMHKNFDCEVFNVGTGKEHSFNEVVDKINRLLNKSVKPIYKPNPIRNYLYHTLADTTKSRNVLQFKAKISLEKGIRGLISTLGRD